jgi:hypothetical protein
VRVFADMTGLSYSLKAVVQAPRKNPLPCEQRV